MVLGGASIEWGKSEGRWGGGLVWGGVDIRNLTEFTAPRFVQLESGLGADLGTAPTLLYTPTLRKAAAYSPDAADGGDDVGPVALQGGPRYGV